MARIQSFGVRAKVVAFADVPELVVTHDLGRLPDVTVLDLQRGGVFDLEDFGVGDFGLSDAYRPMPTVHYDLIHLSLNSFRIRFDASYEGEVHYL